MVPEVKEEEEEDQTVEGNDVEEDGELIGAILYEEILGDVGGHHHKLDLARNRKQKKSDNSKIQHTSVSDDEAFIPAEWW